jgi:hypothetical protein
MWPEVAVPEIAKIALTDGGSAIVALAAADAWAPPLLVTDTEIA